MNPEDVLTTLKWQAPVITEKTFCEQNQNDPNYMAFPWANVIDRKFYTDANSVRAYIKAKYSDKREYYTCCQHVYFHKLIPLFKEVGVKTLYTPHKKKGVVTIDGIRIIACPLFAANIEDPDRNAVFKGLTDDDFKNRPREKAFSFMGSYVPGLYISQIRQRVFDEKFNNNSFNLPSVVINTGGDWHFNRNVYGCGRDLDSQAKLTEMYNKLLLDSRFSLCPSGSGPNSIRLWESLAIGTIPVVLADTLDLPKHPLWDKACLFVPENKVSEIPKMISKISKTTEDEMRANCLDLYAHFRGNFKNVVGNPLRLPSPPLRPQNPLRLPSSTTPIIISYCCDTYPNNFGGVARFEYHLSLAFPKRIFFSPSQKQAMLKFVNSKFDPFKNNILVITDNHLACDIPVNVPTILVHHGCVHLSIERTPSLSNNPFYKYILDGQKRMFTYRKPNNTLILSCSEYCIDNFDQRCHDTYKPFEKKLLWHSSELEYSGPKKATPPNNALPVILGNWCSDLKGGQSIKALQDELRGEFVFRELKTTPTRDIEAHNAEKIKIYGECDMFLQMSVSEGFAYATLDAFNQNLLVCGSNTGLLYDLEKLGLGGKVAEIFDWTDIQNTKLVASKIRAMWKNRASYEGRSRQWFEENITFDKWVETLRAIVDNTNTSIRRVL